MNPPIVVRSTRIDAYVEGWLINRSWQPDMIAELTIILWNVNPAWFPVQQYYDQSEPDSTSIRREGTTQYYEHFCDVLDLCPLQSRFRHHRTLSYSHDSDCGDASLWSRVMEGHHSAPITRKGGIDPAKYSPHNSLGLPTTILASD
jgi:hypothetical protein